MLQRLLEDRAIADSAWTCGLATPAAQARVQMGCGRLPGDAHLKGGALGIFGAGNVGAAGTKLLVRKLLEVRVDG